MDLNQQYKTSLSRLVDSSPAAQELEEFGAILDLETRPSKSDLLVSTRIYSRREERRGDVGSFFLRYATAPHRSDTGSGGGSIRYFFYFLSNSQSYLRE
jgi:hypothetical protein